MFGSNFAANFGIPDFGYQNADPQGGYLGANAPTDPSQNVAPSTGQPVTGSVAAPATGLTSPQTPLAAASPLSGGPLAPGGGQTAQQPIANPEPSQTAPAAGIGSPFGKPGV